jgi:hypothetical protein
MSKVNSFETEILDHIFNNTNIANIGDASGLQPSGADGNLWISLHTANPGETGSVTNEAAYTSYARASTDRDGSDWTVASGQAQNTNLISFPTCTGGSETITHFGIHTASSGSGNMIYSGSLTSSLSVSNGITPQFAATALTVTED